MNLLKTLGLGMYYRVRRISKAFKNWKKFGVVIFGSMLISTSVLPNLVNAAGSLHMAIYPTSSTITLGSDKLFTAQVFNGIKNVTADAKITWLGSINGQTVTIATGASGLARPNQAGTFTINARAEYNGEIVWADTPATLIVTSTEDNRAYGVSVNALTSGNTINVGGSKTYNVTANYGGQPVTDQSTFGWVVTKDGQTVANNGVGTAYTFTPTTSGTYSVKARGIYVVDGITKTAWSLPATLIVNPVTPPPAQIHLTVSIYPTATNPIMVGQHKLYTAQAFNGVNPFTSSVDFAWTASKNGQTVATSTGVTWDYYPAETGTYTINARGTVRSNPSIYAFADTPATLIVQGTPPPAEVCSSVDIIPADIYLQKNTSVAVSYTSLTNKNRPISADNLVWSVNGGRFDSNTLTYYATQAGDFTIAVQCRLNSAVRDSARIHVSDIIINQETLTSTTISADRNPLCLNESTGLSAQAKNNLDQNITDATYVWQWLSGVGHLAGNLNSQYGARFVADNSVGYARIRVTAYWRGQTPVSNEMTIYVNDCSNPNNNQYFIDGYIVSATDDGKPVCAGSILNYTIVLTNRFNTVHGVRLSTSLPLGVTFMSASSSTDSPNIVGRTITWDPGTMVQGQSVTLNIKVQVNDNVRVGTNLRLNAFVQADERPNGFYLSSGDLVVRCGGTTPTEPLPNTGMEVWLLAGLAVISFGLSFLTYRWLDRRMMNRI